MEQFKPSLFSSSSDDEPTNGKTGVSLLSAMGNKNKPAPQRRKSKPKAISSPRAQPSVFWGIGLAILGVAIAATGLVGMHRSAPQEEASAPVRPRPTSTQELRQSAEVPPPAAAITPTALVAPPVAEPTSTPAPAPATRKAETKAKKVKAEKPQQRSAPAQATRDDSDVALVEAIMKQTRTNQGHTSAKTDNMPAVCLSLSGREAISCKANYCKRYPHSKRCN